MQRSLVCVSQFLASRYLLLDLVLELSHVEHQLVDFLRPHRKFFGLELLTEFLRLCPDPIFAFCVAVLVPDLEDPLQLRAV